MFSLTVERYIGASIILVTDVSILFFRIDDIPRLWCGVYGAPNTFLFLFRDTGISGRGGYLQPQGLFEGRTLYSDILFWLYRQWVLKLLISQGPGGRWIACWPS